MTSHNAVLSTITYHVFFSFAPLVVSVGELRQKMIELHTIKTKKGTETTISEKVDLDLHALMLSVGHVGVELQTLVKKSLPEITSKIATRNT